MENRIKAKNDLRLVVRSRPAADGRCKKHQTHQQSPGVCSVCLTERLSQLSRSSKTKSIAWSSSTSSLSSHNYSSCQSSPVHRRFHLAADHRAKGKIDSVIRKSRSMVFAPRKREMEGAEGEEGKKKRGFWSKLLHPRSKKVDAGSFFRSSTLRERPITTVVR
ncbi:uncharacterized protein LOC127807680 [Diospyros lotus]|uniref:uncharacterized protein LOC127807680 n=1 Tax=Diospyros lotus TaxID=55363 RepID=UPI002257A203|nr:uncharacterized protein LOC127807680 [Diospyros lotus]